MSNRSKISETSSFQKTKNKLKYNKIYTKIKDYIYPILRRNPYFGPNIKHLKGKLSGIYRYRIGNYRLFYEINEEKIIVFIIDIADRKDACT